MRETRQVDTLLYCLGEEADSVLSSTNISDEDRKKYDKVLRTFDLYFKVRRNVILDKACFNCRCQKEGESAKQCITELYDLIEFCEYSELKEQFWHSCRLQTHPREIQDTDQAKCGSEGTQS